ncbi:MAG TPA: response regulator [Dissulfurispiraceae bacterium]|nr:response regulator [Dissulfurispiraceae bacterium]
MTQQIKVLLVDDEKAFVDTLALRLKMRNLAVEAVYDGTQAMAFLSQRKENEGPDVIILDLKMPDMSGLDVLRKVKKSFPKIEVIMVTGHGSDKDAEEAKQLGGFDFLKKPVDIETLMNRIREATRKIAGKPITGPLTY